MEYSDNLWIFATLLFGIIIVPGKLIDKSNVDDFMGQMKQMLRK